MRIIVSNYNKAWRFLSTFLFNRVLPDCGKIDLFKKVFFCLTQSGKKSARPVLQYGKSAESGCGNGGRYDRNNL